MPFGRRRAFGGGGGGPVQRWAGARQAVRAQNNNIVWNQGPAQLAQGQAELNGYTSFAQRYSPTAAGIIQQRMQPVLDYGRRQVANGQADFSRPIAQFGNRFAPRKVNQRILQQQASTTATVNGMRASAMQGIRSDMARNWWPIAQEAAPVLWDQGKQAVGDWWGRTRESVGAMVPEGWGPVARGAGMGMLGMAATMSPMVGAGMGLNQAVQNGAFSPANLAGAYARMKVGQVGEKVSEFGGQLGNAFQGGFQSLTRGLGFGGGGAPQEAAPPAPAVGGAGGSAGGVPMGDVP